MYLKTLYNKINNYFAIREDLILFKSDTNFITSHSSYIGEGGDILVHDVNVIVDRMDVFNATNLLYYAKDGKKVVTDVNILLLEDTYREKFSFKSTGMRMTSSEADIAMYIFIPLPETFISEDKMITWDICQLYSFIIYTRILGYWNVTFNTRLHSHLFDCNDYGIYVDWIIPDDCNDINPFSI